MHKCFFFFLNFFDDTPTKNQKTKDDSDWCTEKQKCFVKLQSIVCFTLFSEWPWWHNMQHAKSYTEKLTSFQIKKNSLRFTHKTSPYSRHPTTLSNNISVNCPRQKEIVQLKFYNGFCWIFLSRTRKSETKNKVHTELMPRYWI